VTERLETTAFPPDFLWGAATSAYQVEGATTEDGRGRSIWDQFAATPGRTHAGETGEPGADHYHRIEQDVRLMADLGLTGYRFSIAWPRILPEGTGTVNTIGLDFYERLVDRLLAHGITPVVTLYHWDLPLALDVRGGWRVRDTAHAFADYAEIVARRLGDRVRWWVTHNEPWCAAYLGYGVGLHAPGMQDMQAAVDVGHHLLLSHGLALPRIRASGQRNTRVGMALNLFPIFAADRGVATIQAVDRADRFHNRWFLDPLFRGTYTPGLFEDLGANPPPIQDGDMALISAPTDFLGVNYYNRWVVRGKSAVEGNGSHDGDGAHDGHAATIEYVNDLPEALWTAKGWEVFPHGLTLVLEELARTYSPPTLLITENGAAFDDAVSENGQVNDPQRVAYLREHLNAVATALAHGVPAAGYFVWSLFDNFEWEDGYSKRFGVVYVDYPTQRRIVKDSGRWYAGFIAAQRALRVS
jgi:beta-glucosidase